MCPGDPTAARPGRTAHSPGVRETIEVRGLPLGRAFFLVSRL